jgi:hypothetical protein
MIPEDLLLEAIETVSAWNLDPDEFALAANRQAQFLAEFEFMIVDEHPSPYHALRF